MHKPSRYFCDTCYRFTSTSTQCEHCAALVWIDAQDANTMEMVKDADERLILKRSRQCLFASALLNLPLFVAVGVGLWLQIWEWGRHPFVLNMDVLVWALVFAMLCSPFVVLLLYVWGVVTLERWLKSASRRP